MKTLNELVAEFNLSTDKGAGHSYLDYYEELFKPIDCIEHPTILEIGVDTGASLVLWEKRFPNAYVFGFDISEARINVPCRHFLCDATDANAVGRIMDAGQPVDVVLRPLNLVIDDGSHLPQDQLAAYANLKPYLAPDAIYVIEDVTQFCFVHNPHLYLGMDDSKKIELIDLSEERPERWDNILCVIRPK